MKTKQQKRLEAEARQVEYNSLTLIEKLRRVNNRRGQSKREWKRLTGDDLDNYKKRG